MTQRLTLVLGGARSGKSTYALQQAQQRAQAVQGTVLFVATATALDDEMADRIAKHKSERPAHWRTLEAPLAVGAAIEASSFQNGVVLVDCLTLLSSNVLMALPNPEDPAAAQAALDAEIDGLITAYQSSQVEWIIVSNEVGLGLVPPYPLGRIYRDELGRANQRLAQIADQVVFMVAGLPLFLK